MASLSEADLVCAEVLVGKGRSVRGVARELGVDESTLRYRLKRRALGAVDGRSKQPEACEPYSDVIEAWIARQPWNVEGKRPEAVKVLYESLVAEHGYSGSYKAVLRFVRRRAPKPAVRPSRRVETQPGSQGQVDWAHREVHVQELGGRVRLPVFLMLLSHSRMPWLAFFTDTTQLSWLEAHNRALSFFGGVPYSLRIDNLKTGVKSGAGPWAVLNDSYRSYAEQVGFQVDPTRPRKGSDKGKVERHVREFEVAILKPGERFVNLDDLNQAVHERSLERTRSLVNPVTGESVFNTWLAERELLQPLPESLPTPFDVQVTRRVSRDCLVRFEGREYTVPFRFAGRDVQVRGVPGRVQVLSGQKLLVEYPRHTKAKLLIDQACYEGDGDENVAAPTPLGKLGREIVVEKSWEAPTRPLSAYENLIRSLS